MKKIVIFIIVIVLIIGSFLFLRPYLPGEQVKHDVMMQYLSSTYKMNESLNRAFDAYEDNDEDNFAVHLNRASSHLSTSNELTSDGINVSEHLNGSYTIQRFTFLGYGMLRDNSARAIRGEITEEDIEDIIQFSEQVERFFDRIGTPSSIGQENHTPNQMVELIEEALRAEFDNLSPHNPDK
ncbi:hypothetical protein [Salsuginibacillus kocurii]|uniref:hypothetical protein n=1 Tax=Salsuginibacillus kocurii TaxID=427078 RepID=UPI000375AF67|nr:hypothetical protein [Salsuginibacillus kocurii]